MKFSRWQCSSRASLYPRRNRLCTDIDALRICGWRCKQAPQRPQRHNCHHYSSAPARLYQARLRAHSLYKDASFYSAAPNSALELEEKGYDWIKQQVDQNSLSEKMISAQKAFAQYIDLYKDSVAHVSVSPMLTASEPQRARRAREGNHADISRPDPMGGQRLSAPEMFAPDYGVNILGVRLPVDAASSFRCGVPRLNSLRCSGQRRRHYPTQNTASDLPEGLTVCFAPRCARRYFSAGERGLVAQPCRRRPCLCSTRLFLHDGVLCVYARRGVKGRQGHTDCKHHLRGNARAEYPQGSSYRRG